MYQNIQIGLRLSIAIKVGFDNCAYMIKFATKLRPNACLVQNNYSTDSIIVTDSKLK